VEGEVYRPVSVKVRYRDLDFAEQTVEADGLLARVLQHEIDHLNGVLFIDHLGKARRLTIMGKLRKIKKETEAQLAAQGGR
jgi:peptide deformylase